MAEAFLKWAGPKPMNRFSSPTTRGGSGVARNFKRGRVGIISTFFVKRIFFGRTNLKLIKKQEKLSGGSGGMLPRNIFENLHAATAILVPFKIFRQIVFKFFDLNSECFAKYDTFCSHIFNYACLRRKTYSYQRGSKLEKNCIHQKLF